MKIKTDFLKTEKGKLLLAVLVNLIFLALVLSCFEVRYEENDDLAVQKLLDGQTAVKSAFVVYINYFLAFGLKTLYTLTGDALPIFPMLQYTLLFLSFTGLSYMLFKKLNTVGALTASLAVLCFFGADSYIYLTYTKTAGVCTVGGLNLMFLAMEENRGTKKWLPLILGAAMVVLGFALRDKASAACLALMAALGLYGLLRRCIEAPEKKLKAAFRYALPFVLVIVICAGLFGASEYIWNNSEYYDYKLYNAARSQFMDYGIPRYDEMSGTYDELGIDQNALDIFSFYDTDLWSRETFEAATEGREAITIRPSPGECLGIFLDVCIRSFFIQRHVYGFVAALLLWAAAGKRDWLSWLTLAASLAVFGVLYLLLIYQGRYLVNRTDVGFFFAITVTVLWLLSGEKLRKERILCLLLVPMCLFIGYRLNRHVSYLNEDNALTDRSADIAAAKLLIDDGHLFLTEVGAVNHVFCSPLETAPAGYSDSIILLGDWYAGHPAILQRMSEFGIENPYRDVVDNEQVYMIPYDLEKTMAYINGHYDPDATAELVEPLSSQTGLEIYRILD